MPSPVGHALGGMAAGWLVTGRAAARGTPGRFRRGGGLASLGPYGPLFAALGAAPDLDLLFGTHSTYTHSIGAVALTAVVALLCTKGRQPRLAFACAAAVASHILLDWLGSDTTAPIGIMAFWPFTNRFYQSPFFLFMAISRRWWLPGFFVQNGLAMLRELAILLPIVAVAGIMRARSAMTR